MGQTFCHGVGTPAVISVKIQKHKEKNKDATSCYGFVNFRDHDSAATAFALLNNKIMKEHELNVNWSREKQPSSQPSSLSLPRENKNQWQCKDPSCGVKNPENKDS